MAPRKTPGKRVPPPSHEAEFEFFGPHVPGLLLFILPAVLYGLIFGCNRDGCLLLSLTSPYVSLPTKGVYGWPYCAYSMARIA